MKTKTLLAAAICAAVGVGASGVANAATGSVLSFTLKDMDGNNQAGDFNFGSPPTQGDGFNDWAIGNPIAENCGAATTGSTHPGSGTCNTTIPFDTNIATNVFTTGFVYGGFGYVSPYVTDGTANGGALSSSITGTVDGNAANDSLLQSDLSSWDWAIDFTTYGPPPGFVPNTALFLLSPDAGTFTANILSDNNDGTFNSVLTWSHLIFDPNPSFNGQTAFWRMEGVLNTDLTAAPAVPVPSAVWLMGSGLAGLAGVARRRKQKKDETTG